jgi:hypothetical protein
MTALLVTGGLIALASFGAGLALGIAAMAAATHAEATAEVEDDGEWIEPGAAFDYITPYRGKATPQ